MTAAGANASPPRTNTIIEPAPTPKDPALTPLQKLLPGLSTFGPEIIVAVAYVLAGVIGPARLRIMPRHGEPPVAVVAIHRLLILGIRAGGHLVRKRAVVGEAHCAGLRIGGATAAPRACWTGLRRMLDE